MSISSFIKVSLSSIFTHSNDITFLSTAVMTIGLLADELDSAENVDNLLHVSCVICNLIDLNNELS